MKKLIYKAKFYFFRSVTWKDLDFHAKRSLLVFTQHENRDPRKLVFVRTFNNCITRGFSFIGFQPVFRAPEFFWSYFATWNEID